MNYYLSLARLLLHDAKTYYRIARSLAAYQRRTWQSDLDIRAY